jgi:hypothetical protein
MCTTFDESVVGGGRHVFKVRVFSEFRHVFIIDFIVDEFRRPVPGGFTATIEWNLDDGMS